MKSDKNHINKWINIKKKETNPPISSGKLKINISISSKFNINASGPKNIENIKIEKIKNIDFNELPFLEAFEKDKRKIYQIFLSFFYLKLKTIQIIFFRDEFLHFSLSFSLYVFEILLDITINSLLFSDDVISQKYYNNGELLFITTNMLSISSNIISFFILLLTQKSINQNLVLSNITKEIKNSKDYYRIFIKLTCCFRLKLMLFFSILLSIGLFCTYYLFVFCAIYHKIQKNLFVNYIMSSLWSFGFTIFICLFVTITRKISINKKNKRLYIISTFINDMF